MVDFWGLIGSNSVDSAAEMKSALDRVSSRLEGLRPVDLIRFVQQLQEHVFRLDRRELAEIPVLLAGGLELPQTSDHFLYARCRCVLAGKDAFDLVMRSNAEFGRFVSPSALSAEGLLYVASVAYRNETGREMEPVSSFPIESRSNPQGWNE